MVCDRMQGVAWWSTKVNIYTTNIMEVMLYRRTCRILETLGKVCEFVVVRAYAFRTDVLLRSRTFKESARRSRISFGKNFPSLISRKMRAEEEFSFTIGILCIYNINFESVVFT